MGQLEEMIKKLIATGEIVKNDPSYVPPLGEDIEFQESYIDHCISDAGLVFCCNCQRFIDDEHHDIKHVFARSAREIREKSILERMAGNITESDSKW